VALPRQSLCWLLGRPPVEHSCSVRAAQPEQKNAWPAASWGPFTSAACMMVMASYVVPAGQWAAAGVPASCTLAYCFLPLAALQLGNVTGLGGGK